MKKSLASFPACFVLLLVPGISVARNHPASPAANFSADDKTPPSYDMKAQSLLDLRDLHKKMISLAQAIPPDKYAWRPETGARSVSELFLHVTAANHNILSMMTGVSGDPLFKAKGFEASTSDKAKIIAELDESFSYAESEIQAMSNADFARPEKKLGPEANSGGVIYLLLTHNHEHFGQSIAYARMNGITPPWTVEAEKKAKEVNNAGAPKQD